MGTSKSNAGPRGNSPLLPPWAPEPPKDDVQQNSDTENSAEENQDATNEEGADSKTNSFSNARRAVTNYAKNNNRQNFNKAARSYIKSYGGSKKASKTAISGKSSGLRFSGFVSGVANRGIEQSLRDYGLSDCIGKSADYVLTKIADLIAPSGATNEDAAAREAVIDALSFLYDHFELNDKDITELDAISKPDFELVLKEYLSSYIFNRWLHELGIKFEEKSASTRDLVRIENEAKEYITEAVKLDLSKVDLLRTDFNSGEGKKIIDKIFEEAYNFIEAL